MHAAANTITIFQTKDAIDKMLQKKPPQLPSAGPMKGPMRRAPFQCGAFSEPVMEYRKGGYHPTHLGDTFNDGRYKIMHKLGWGSYSTVWLAKDLVLVYSAVIGLSFSFQNDLS